MAEANYWRLTAKQMMLAMVAGAQPAAHRFGRTVSGGGATVMVEVARMSLHTPVNDWLLVHELSIRRHAYITAGHLGSWKARPPMSSRSSAPGGMEDEEEVWREWIDQMPQGASAFDTGLSSGVGRRITGAVRFSCCSPSWPLRRATCGAMVWRIV